MDSGSVAAIVIGALLLLLGTITLTPGAIDRFFQLIYSPYMSIYRDLLGFRQPERQFEWSRRLAHIWMPAMSFLVGIMLILKGTGVLE
jgi:dipeptide/tripeptide permease